MFAPHGRRRTPGRSSQSGLALVPAKRWDLRFIIDTLLTGGRDRESALEACGVFLSRGLPLDDSSPLSPIDLPVLSVVFADGSLPR